MTPQKLGVGWVGRCYFNWEYLRWLPRDLRAITLGRQRVHRPLLVTPLSLVSLFVKWGSWAQLSSGMFQRPGFWCHGFEWATMSRLGILKTKRMYLPDNQPELASTAQCTWGRCQFLPPRASPISKGWGQDGYYKAWSRNDQREVQALSPGAGKEQVSLLLGCMCRSRKAFSKQ